MFIFLENVDSEEVKRMFSEAHLESPDLEITSFKTEIFKDEFVAREEENRHVSTGFITGTAIHLVRLVNHKDILLFLKDHFDEVYDDDTDEEEFE